MEETDQQKAIFVGILRKHWCDLRFDRKHKSAIGTWNSKHCCKCILRLDNSWELPCFWGLDGYFIDTLILQVKGQSEGY